MILSPPLLAVLKPVMALQSTLEHANTVLCIHMPGHYGITVDISAAGITVKATHPDSGPTVEHYRSPAALANAYGLPLARITNLDEGD